MVPMVCSFAALLTAALPALAAPALGVATAEGPFRLNSALVRNTATLTAGAAIETGATPSRLHLSSGARFRLDAHSRARVFASHLVLEQGSGELTASSYAIEARSLRIIPSAPNARARVALRDGNFVQVASASGRFRVHNAAGVLVSHLDPGYALEFEPQITGPGAPSSFVGCLLRKDGKFVLYDQTTRMIVELRGEGFEKEVGNRVQANGAARASSPQASTQILDVTSIVRIEQGGCDDVASAIGAERAPSPRAAPTTTSSRVPSAPQTGMSAGAKVAIVAALAGGGAAGAVVATQSGDSRSR
jgi:hypothetical protein